MDEIAHGLYAPPAGRDCPEQIPRRLAQLVSLAISAPHQKEQTGIGQLRDRHFTCGKVRWVDLAIVFDRGVAPDREITGWRDQSAASIAKGVEIGGRGNDWRREDLLGDAYVGLSIFAHRQQANECGRLRGIDRDFITVTDQHWSRLLRRLSRRDE